MLAYLKNHLRSSLVMNSYLLMVTRFIGGSTGFVFWALAARLTVAENFGIASGAVSTALLLAGLAQFGFGYGLVRYLPQETRPSNLINLSLEFSAIASLGLSWLFLLTLGWFSPALISLRASFIAGITFVSLVVSTSLLQIVNWVFFARRKFVYSLVTLSVQSFAAILLLALLPTKTDQSESIIEAYNLSTIIGLLVALVLLVRYGEAGYRVQFVSPRLLRLPLVGYMASSFISDQIQKNSGAVLMLMSLNLLGAEPSAYFFIAWAITSGLLSLVGGISSSLFAEGANRPDSIGLHIQRSLKLGLFYSLVAVLGTGLLSPFILSFYGPNYVTYGIRMFLFMLVAVVPGIVIAIYVTHLRLYSSPYPLSLFTGLDFIVQISFCYFGARWWGLIGIGLGILISRLVMFLIVVGLWRWERVHAQRTISF